MPLPKFPLDPGSLGLWFDWNKEARLEPYVAKDVDGNVVAKRGYDQIWLSPEEAYHHFGIDPINNRGCQFVYMPPNYEMVIHRDISYLKSRIGILIDGEAPLLFYDDDHNIIDEYNYEHPVLMDTQVLHNVKNTDEYRLTFFINIERPFEEMVHELNKYT